MAIGFSPKQLLSLKESDSRINVWEGAVRSGKTYISLWRFLKELTYGMEGDYALITRTYDSFKRNILPQLMRMIGGDIKHYQGKRELHIWKKTVHVIGADDERAENKIRGATFMGAYVDEATIIPESVFKMLISRCSMNGSKIFATTNPDSPFHWFKRDYLEGNPDVKSWQFTLDDNPELTEVDREYLKRQYKGIWHQRFILGRWVQAEGSIYDFFEEKYHVIDYPTNRAEYYIVGIDYGTTNPTSFILIGVNTFTYPNVWIEDEYYYDSRVHQRQKTDLEYSEDFMKFVEGRYVKTIYIDPAALSFKVQLRRDGVDCIENAQNEVLDGIRMVSRMMSEGSMKVCRRCKNLIREIQSYVWDSRSHKIGNDKPLKENDHALDALRYAIFTHFFAKNQTSVNWAQVRAEAYGSSEMNLPPNFQQPSNLIY